MSGHSKWKNIMHKKEKTDAQRGKIFTKIGREIAVIVKEGGPDPNSNFKLKDVIAKAKANNVPNENIERIIKKAAGGGEGDEYERNVYEGYGPCGVALIVHTLTNNRNRTAGDMRHYFDKFGGNLGQSGSVSWQFSSKGVIIIDTDSADEDEMIMNALDAGAEDVLTGDGVYEIITAPEQFMAVRTALEERKYAFLSAQIEMIPSKYVELSEEDDVKNMQRLLDVLEEDDDVQEVFHNWEE